MRNFWHLSSLMASWWYRRAVKAVGIYRFSRAAVTHADMHVCNDENCPRTVVVSAMHDTHLKVRNEALLVVGMAVSVGAVFVFIFVELMNRLV